MSELLEAFGRLNLEQKAAAVGAVLLAVSTFGPFSFVEAAEILVALGVLALLRARALGRRFHLPFGDGTVIAGAGIWAAGLIVVRLFDRPLGQNLLALACAAILVAAGARERAKRPPDDLPPDRGTPPIRRAPRPPADPGAPAATAAPAGPARAVRGAARPGRDEQETALSEEQTEPLPPPEFEPYRPAPGEQLHLGGEEEDRGAPPAAGA
jgi:hypothetical protein